MSSVVHKPINDFDFLVGIMMYLYDVLFEVIIKWPWSKLNGELAWYEKNTLKMSLVYDFKLTIIIFDNPVVNKTTPSLFTLARVWLVSIRGHHHMTSTFAYTLNIPQPIIDIFISVLWEV